MVNPGPIYTERLFGAAMMMKKTDKTLFLVMRFLKATTSFVVCFIFVLWSGLLSCVFVPGTLLVFHLLYTLINCDCLVYSVSQFVTTK